MNLLHDKDIPDWETAIDEARRYFAGRDSSEHIVFNDARFEPKSLDDAIEVINLATRLLLVSKQKKYGKENILEFGHHGLVIRTNDKLKRLKNSYFKGVDLGKEGVVESWGDMVGYGALGIALEKGWFTLPLTNEDVK